MTRWQAALALAGGVAWLGARGPLAAGSFAAGALASAASFWLLGKFTSALGPGPARPALLAAASLRILLIGGALFAIMQNYELQPAAAATGILITVAAITIEAIRKSFYA